MAMDALVREWITSILGQRLSLLSIALRQRAKFEGWLKFELAAYAERQGATFVQVETPSTDALLSFCRSDLTFSFNGLRYDVEIKTPNANWRVPSVLNMTRPITKNIDEIIIDGRKLRTCGGRGIIAFVLFPVPQNDLRWTEYLRRIAQNLNLPLSEKEHTNLLSVPLGAGHTADVVICCFTVSSEGSS